MSNRLDQTRYPNLASIEAKKFRLGLKGYSVREVDQFLSALVVEIGALQSALDTAESEVARLRARAAT
jgi:DivIVA domain-containing protein